MQETGNNKIDFSKSEQYTLSIRLSTDGFSFSIYNPIHESSLSFFEKETNASLSLTANLKQFFRETEFLTLPYRRVNILMADKRFTHVPTDFFEEEQAGILFYHNHSPKENEIVLHNVLSRSNVTVIFGMDRSAYLFLKEQYPEARFYSQASPLNEYFSTKSRLGNSKKMYVSLRKNAMDLFCYERGHLLLANSLNVNKPPTVSTICFIYGSNSASIRNGTNFISQVFWPTKKIWLQNYVNSSFRYLL